MRVAMRDDRYVPFLQFDRFESGTADERYPARTAGDDMILDRVLGAGRYLVSDLRSRWRFRNPWRFGGDVKKDRSGKTHGGEDIGQCVRAHRHNLRHKIAVSATRLER